MRGTYRPGADVTQTTAWPGVDEVIAFDPAVNRVFVRFTDNGGVVRGATSVAVQTQ